MRVLHLIGTLNPESGGPATSLATLIGLAPPGSYNEVVTLDDPAAAFLNDSTFPVTALGPTRSKYGFNVRLIPWLKANREGFDGVIVHGLWQFCGIAALIALRGRTPYMVFVHGMLDPWFKRAFPFKHAKKWLYWLLAEHWVLRSASRVLFTCEAEERLARQSFWLHAWTSHVVPFGTSDTAGDDGLRRAALIARFPALEGRRYLLFLGRIDRKKGCDLLIRAFMQTAALDTGLHLVLAGPDPQGWRRELERPLLATALYDRVHWTGMLKGDEKWGAFLNCDAFILPSHQENFGIAVAEALACGKPVLLADKVNIAPEIALNGAGFMEPDTVAGTTRLIARWLATPPETRLAMGASARACFEARYDMRRHAHELGSLFARTARPGFPAPIVSDPVAE